MHKCQNYYFSKLSGVRNGADSNWALFRAALSTSKFCPVQRWVHLSSVPDSAESIWVLSRTTLSQCEFCPPTALNPCEFCPGQRWVNLSSAPGQRWVHMSSVPDSAESIWVLPPDSVKSLKTENRWKLMDIYICRIRSLRWQLTCRLDSLTAAQVSHKLLMMSKNE